VPYHTALLPANIFADFSTQQPSLIAAFRTAFIHPHGSALVHALSAAVGPTVLATERAAYREPKCATQ
jgi:hypothetical protein